ncbi:MAG: hypothetical protein OES09_00430 [Gammaproteobacteria bacterium]|nr:hypothetical protein [Gammaproteobacteria bacterium]
MFGGPVFEFAEAQARIRARVGAMPKEARWRYIADATALDNLIERMRDNGLGYWVQELPRTPDTAAIEDYLRQRLRMCIEGVARLLPHRWNAAQRWLRLGAVLVLVEQVLVEEKAELGAASEKVLALLDRLPLAGRWDHLRQTPYQHYIGKPLPFEAWLENFPRHLPPLTRHERYIVHRLQNIVSRHHRQIQAACDRALEEEHTIDTTLQWRLRSELAENLRELLGGYPFHAGLIMIYGLLELLQYERCRALLIGRSRGWERPGLFAGAPA